MLQPYEMKFKANNGRINLEDSFNRSVDGRSIIEEHRESFHGHWHCFETCQLFTGCIYFIKQKFRRLKLACYFLIRSKCSSIKPSVCDPDRQVPGVTNFKSS
jgi:hypothetical protein